MVGDGHVVRGRTAQDRVVFVAFPGELWTKESVPRLRLDEILVARGLAESRTQARALIMSGRVLRGTERLDKPGREYADDVILAVEQPPRFVSRGGEKLSAFLIRFSIDVRGRPGPRRGGIDRWIHGLRAAGRRSRRRPAWTSAAASSTPACARIPRVVNIEKKNARHLRAGRPAAPHL